jgi:hypothetical protein
MIRRRLIALALAGASACLAATVGAGAASAQAGTAPDANDQIVQDWYVQFLGRSWENAAADTGRSYWVGLLAQGRSREYVLGGILRSTEYATREVSSYYTRLLGRQPDPGAAYWIDQTAHHGMAWEWVAQNVLASSEYYNRSAMLTPGNPATPGTYMDALFQEVLGRRSTSISELNWWYAHYIQVGALTTVRDLWYTDEAVRHRVDHNYQQLLWHGADAAGLSYWSPLERQSDISVQVAIAATPEYDAKR